MRIPTFALALLCCISFASVNSAQAATWNLANDFSVEGNPNGVWTYGWESSGSDGALPTNNGSLHLYNGTSSGNQWFDNNHQNSANHTPGIWKNLTSNVINTVTPGQVALHPGNAVEIAPYRWVFFRDLSVVRWTSPIQGIINISGMFGEGDVGHESYYISVNGTTLYQWVTQAGSVSFNFDLAVQLGTIIDFLVGVPINGVYTSGTTPLDVSISYDATTPLPAALPLFTTGAGLLGLVGWRRKRKAAAAA